MAAEMSQVTSNLDSQPYCFYQPESDSGQVLLARGIAAIGVWFGGWVDNLIQSISQVNMILPALPIAITVYLV